jgi:hypothetical protein
MSQLGIATILENAAMLDSVPEKIEYLKRYYSRPLLELLQYTFDCRIKWLLEKGPVPYKRVEFAKGQPEGLLYNKVRKFYLYTATWKNGKQILGKPGMTQDKREQLFVQDIESLAEKEANLLIAIKDRHLHFKGGLPPRVIEMAYPNKICWADDKFGMEGIEALAKIKTAKKEKTVKVTEESIDEESNETTNERPIDEETTDE